MLYIINIKHSHFYQEHTIQYLMTKTIATVEKWEFFIHSTNSKFCSSPDATGPVGLIIEIKARSLNSKGPLQSSEKIFSHFGQTQL